MGGIWWYAFLKGRHRRARGEMKGARVRADSSVERRDVGGGVYEKLTAGLSFPPPSTTLSIEVPLSCGSAKAS